MCGRLNVLVKERGINKYIDRWIRGCSDWKKSGWIVKWIHGRREREISVG